MLELTSPSQGLLFFSFLFRSDLFSQEIFTQKVEALFGQTISFTPTFNPLATYYAKEMGEVSDLKRIFLVTDATFPREFLLSSKLMALNWEREWGRSSGRLVNVDVGFVSAENFILATTKNYAHRIFLGQNIFADLTYQSVGGEFQVLPWTYPDFKDPEKMEFLNWCRNFLLMHSKVRRA